MSITTYDEAINRVLLAEKEACQEVDSCRHQAAVIITDGRERVRHIMNRADERINRVQTIADRITRADTAGYSVEYFSPV